jgi:hypothetical protein
MDETRTGLSGQDDDEYARFDDLARKLINTPKPKPSAAELPPSAGEPAEDGAEREETDGDGR